MELSKIIDKGGSGKMQAGKRKEKSPKKKRIDGNESSSDEEVGKVAAKKARTSSKKKIFDDEEDDKEDDKMDEDSDSGKGGKKKKQAKKNAMDMIMMSKGGRKTKKVVYADSGSDDDDLMDSDEEVVHKNKKKAAKKSNGKAAKGKKSTSKGKRKKGKGGSDSEDEFQLGSEPEDEDESFAADSESEMEIDSDSEEEAPKKKKKGDKKAAKKPASKKAAAKKESAKEKKAAGKGKKAAPESIEALCAAKEKDINLLNNPQKFPEDGPYVEPVGIDATDGIVEGIIGGMVKKVGKLLLGTLKREDNERELGELNFPIKLNTACSGTDAPSIALGLVKESLDRFCSQATDEDGNDDRKEGQGFEYEHNMSCEIEPFKQAYIGRNFPGVLLFPDITKLTEKETVVDVYGRAQTIPESKYTIYFIQCAQTCRYFDSHMFRHLFFISRQHIRGRNILQRFQHVEVVPS